MSRNLHLADLITEASETNNNNNSDNFMVVVIIIIIIPHLYINQLGQYIKCTEHLKHFRDL